MVWRNERTFYPSSCTRCHTPIIACFAPNVPFPILCNECWWSNEFDPLATGRDFDFSRPFFEQFSKLINITPVGNLFIANSENSEYSQLSVGNKNCYMILASDYNENSLYLDNSNHNKDAGDLSFSNKSELSHASVDIYESYGCHYSQNLKNCNSCMGCVDCGGSSNLLGCIGIRNGSYMIFNKQYSKESYEQKKRALRLDTYSGMQQFLAECQNFVLKYPRKYSYLMNCQGSSGNYLTNSSSCVECFDMSESQDCKYSIFSYKTKDAYDIYGAPGTELTYYSCAIPENYNIHFSAIIWPGSTNVYYSYLCRTARNCFGCVSLHNNEFCILNKQYTEKDYQAMTKKIKSHMKATGEWGNFFPMHISPWAYNETIAYDYYRKDKTTVESIGARWQDQAVGQFGNETLNQQNIPDAISEVPGSIVKEILACQDCGRNYKIIESELKFYKKLCVPLPRLCPTCRYHNRIALRNPRALWTRQCMCTQTDHHHEGRCQTNFETTYSPDRKEIVYCEECYQKEIY
ncbi:MAG TPA: hypothetical protein DEG44_02360 [Candidatus Kerfeldbacteria bacterium]|nr:hypothetical protein [Candidatus Kerfeldbacteria bacterium]